VIVIDFLLSSIYFVYMFVCMFYISVVLYFVLVFYLFIV
jgi:hypothetical protein